MKLYTCLCCCFCVLSLRMHAQYYPASEMYTESIRWESDPAVMEQMTRQYEEKYHDADRPKLYCVETFADRVDMEKVRYYLNSFKDESYKHAAACSAIKILLAGKHYQEAEELLQPYIHLDLKKLYPQEKVGPSPLVFKSEGIRFFYYYAEVLYHKGDYKTSMQYMQTARDIDRGSTFFDQPQRELLSLLYMRLGKINDASSDMYFLVINGPDRDKEFLAAAKKVLPDCQGMIKASNSFRRNRTIQLIREKNLSIPMPDVLLKDKNGKDFSLKSLHGKTVFIYFWTIDELDLFENSFAIIQREKEYYAKDSNVVFISIHTYEKTANTTTEAAKYLARKGYTMDLYFDLYDPVKKMNPMAHALKMVDNMERAWGREVIILNKEGIGKFKQRSELSKETGFEDVHAMIDAVRGMTKGEE